MFWGSIFVVAAGSYFLSYVMNAQAMSKIPMIGKEMGNQRQREKIFLGRAKMLLQQGYHKFKKNGIFRITTAEGTRVIINRKFLDEIRDMSDDIISFESALEETLETKYTTIPTDEYLINHCVKADLTPGLARLTDAIDEEVKHGISTELPQSTDWTAIKLSPKLLRMVAMISGRVFIGPDNCRNESWIKIAVDYTLNVFTGQRAIKAWRPIWRPFVYRFLPEIREIHARREDARKLLVPIVQQREAMKGKWGDNKPDDMMQWMMDKADAWNVKGDERQAFQQLTLSMAAIHTTVMSVTQALYDLAAMPQYIQPLRDEVKEALSQSGGKFDRNVLSKLHLMDSFMKESQRYNPPGFTSFRRKVRRGVSLSDGTYLPAGVTIEVPSHAIARDPELYPDPEKFDAYRFYNMRKEGHKDADRHQFVAVTPASLHFGYGKHACPGRFFAASEIKLILANMLLQYDIKVDKPEEGRYKNIEFAHQNIPDPRRDLLFRKLRT
ncbi:cytochrome P450 [Lophium mytilinum]|uniref:Cytochrome P450 n=1 Tax=Lophium mytilinum TaxID=390894 RepID=A0A6A6QJ69_9PEZI|nr:cytochrome P450 [Lophium mytilinum]